MGARVSAETHKAIKLVLRGIAVHKAAARYDLAPSTVYRAMERQGLKALESVGKLAEVK